MKKSFLIACAAVGLLLGSCAGTPQPKELSEIQNADINDSVAYYWGQMLATRYWQQSKRDSTLSTPEGKEAYIKGFQAAFDMAKADNEAFNIGLYSGIEVFLGITSNNEYFSIDIDKETLLSGLAMGMKSDTAVNAIDVDAKMKELTSQLQLQKEARDRVVADSLITAKMKTDGFKKNEKGYIYKITSEGKGNKLEPMDQVLLEISFSKIDGTPLIPTMGAEKFVVDQNRYGHYINTAIKDMPVGSSYQYLSMAADVFGSNMPRQLNVGSADVILWTVKIAGYCDNEGKPSETVVKATPIVEKKTK